MSTIWVVDDDRGVRFVLATALREAGHTVVEFERAAAALAALDEGTPDLLFTDVRMPGEDGLALLQRLREAAPALPVVVMSAYTDVATTAGAFRGGAREYLAKPFDLDEAVALVARTLAAAGGAPDHAGPPPAPWAADALLGTSPPMRELFRAIGRLAQAPVPVLVTGETGTGKELVARALHRESPRAGRPLVAINTAAIPADLLESELFGHEAGAFTGAQRRRAGRFEQADGGTLFLDEIGDMPAALQTRLLRVLAEGEFFRVGGRELVRVDVRVIAATHQDLESLVEQGRFRADLLHRLDVVRLRLPPLRERTGDIPGLAARFLEQAAARLGAPPRRVLPDALDRLVAHPWPGNVRELENLCWRLATLAPDVPIDARQVGALLGAGSPGGADAAPAPAAGWEHGLSLWVREQLEAGAEGVHARALDRFEQAVFDAALVHADGNRSEAAARLGIGRNTLGRKLGRRAAD